MNDGIESKNSEISTETEEGFDKKAYFKRELISFLNLVITVALATAAAALFRRSAGIAAMIPYAVLISFAAAFKVAGVVDSYLKHPVSVKIAT